MRWRARAAPGAARRAAHAPALCVALWAALAGAAAPAPFDAMAPPDGAEPVWSSPRAPGAYAAPVAPAPASAPAPDEPPATVALEGGVAWATWRMAAPSSRAAARAFAAPYRADGFETVLDCDAASCGGFDFRLALETAPWPQMRLSALDLHQITLRRGDALASILASMAGEDVFVQVVTVENAVAAPALQPGQPQPGPAQPAEETASGGERSPRPDPQAPPRPEAKPASTEPTPNATPRPTEGGSPGAPLDPAALAAALLRDGRAVLSGVDFESGGAAPDPASAAALDRAAQALALLGDRSAVVVGHTDDAGALAVNLRVSAARAEAVRAALVARGVSPGRLQAEGAGWLSPVAPNDSDANRALNRRVELLLR